MQHLKYCARKSHRAGQNFVIQVAKGSLDAFAENHYVLASVFKYIKHFQRFSHQLNAMDKHKYKIKYSVCQLNNCKQ